MECMRCFFLLFLLFFDTGEMHRCWCGARAWRPPMHDDDGSWSV